MANATTYADYQVLSGAKTTLDASSLNKQVEFSFDMPSNIVITNGTRRPVLAFHARVHKETMLKVFVNEQQILSWTLGTDTTVKGLWAPWAAADIFQEGAPFANPTKVRFSVSQQGKLDIENVLMWHQVSDSS